MNNEYIVAEFLDSIDTIINRPIQSTQRIKYTSWDVSQNYIIFGANSGGLYVFKRHPCSFIKLIPNGEGAVMHICISLDEKIIAIATSKGTTCLVYNTETQKDIEIYNPHEGSVITTMKWNDSSNELYTGDNSGRISVVVVTNFITKTMFQTPCATLMHLDSQIVQLDWCSNFLLVSTLTRSYLCDTVREHYRPIGKKLRDGKYGACFFGSGVSGTNSSDRNPEISTFRILSDKESFVTYAGLENLKIFCARPGLRLWEVQLHGNVIRTHQFKEALSLDPSIVIPISDDDDCRLTLEKAQNSSKGYSANFIKLYILDSQFIITFQKNGLYIFDPCNVTVVFWTNTYTDIVDVKLFKNIIYLWTSKNKMHVLLFSSLEKFVLKCLFNKMYLLCADLCVIYQKQLKKLIPSSKKLHLLSILKGKLSTKTETDLNEKCQPIFELIERNSKEKQVAQKLASGIFVVDNVYVANSFVESDFQNINTEKCNNPEDLMIRKENENACREEMPINEATETDNKKFSLMYEDYELYKVNKLYRTHMAEEILDHCSSMNEVIEVFQAFRENSMTSHPKETAIEIWCQEKCLEYAESKTDTNLLFYDSKSDTYLLEAFQNINYSNEDKCECGYPLPKAAQNKPKYLKIGCFLADLLWKNNKPGNINLCDQVPYMWKYYLKLNYDDDLMKLLPLILQYGDVELFNFFLNKFTYDMWNETLQKFILLKKGTCLNCEKIFCSEDITLTWKDIATQMIKSIGAESTVCLLLQNANNIPSSELDADFYQCTIFANIVENFDTSCRENAVNFVTELSQNNQLNSFGKLLEKTLQHPKTISTLETSKISSESIMCRCPYCKMSLQVPVLSKEKFVRLECGHTYHNLCINIQNNICKICN